MANRMILLLGLVLVAACSSDPSEVGSAGTIPEGAVAVSGTSTCTYQYLGSARETDGTEVITERFSCETAMSDSRASGIEEYPAMITRVADPAVAGLWTTEGATLTNAGGVWRATGHGVVDLVGVSPLAQGVWPFNYGEIRYTGEGNYEGLTMHLYITGTNFNFALAGWIDEGT